MLSYVIAIVVVVGIIALVVTRRRRDADPAHTVRDFTRALSALERTEASPGTPKVGAADVNDVVVDVVDDHPAAS